MSGGGKLPRNRLRVFVRADDERAGEKESARAQKAHDAANHKTFDAHEQDPKEPTEHEPTARDTQIGFQKTQDDQKQNPKRTRHHKLAVLLQTGNQITRVVQSIERE